MRNVAVAFRSLHPERTSKQVADVEAGRSAAIRAMNDFTDTLFGGPGWTMTASFNFDGSIWPNGFKRTEGVAKAEDVRTGLRFDAKSRQLLPAKRTDEGRALARTLDGLHYSFPLIDGLGGVVHATDGERGYYTGWSFHSLAGEVFATLSVPNLQERGQSAALDEFWEPAPLSEFHAANEKQATA